MSISRASVYFNYKSTVSNYRTAVVSALLRKRHQYQEHHHGEQNPSEARRRDWYRPEPNQIPTQELQNLKETEFQEQQHQAQRRLLHPRASIWHWKIWGLYWNPHQLRPTRILHGRLPQTSNLRRKSFGFGTPNQNHKGKQSIRYWRLYGGVWLEVECENFIWKEAQHIVRGK